MKEYKVLIDVLQIIAIFISYESAKYVDYELAKFLKRRFK